MRKAVLILAALWFVACEGTRPPIPPTQPPQPTPTPSPTPAALSPLRTSGTKFVNDAGPVLLVACNTCCSDASKSTDGWPWSSESAMLTCKANGGTAIEMRNGPNNGSEAPVTLFVNDPTKYGFDAYLKTASGKYDLTKWNPVFWAAFNKLISLAWQQGMYVGVDVVDRWVLRQHLSPWQNDRNVQGAEYEDPSICLKTPKLWHAAWITKVATEAGKYPNTYFLTGNEGFLPPGDCGKPWEEGMVDIIRDVEKKLGYKRHLVGSNCQVTEIEKSPKIDFVVTHSKMALPPRWGKPMYTNEQGDTNSAAQWSAQFKTAKGLGSSWTLWRGNMSDSQYAAALSELKKAQGVQ